MDPFHKYLNILKGKKLLILGGASQHLKIVEAAQEMDVITYVTDYLLDHAPAKEMADFSYNINLTDLDNLVELCKKEKIDGIASGWLDFPQASYQMLCEKTGLPCYGTREQFDLLTRKEAFKELCRVHGVGTPKIVTKDDIEHFPEELPFPIIVKPSSSAGSKGAAIVNTKTDLLSAIQTAKEASLDKKAIAEKYIKNGRAFLVVYFFHKGQAYVQQLSDAFFGNIDDGMEKINVAYRSPFSLSDNYMELANERVVAMLKSIGVDTGPVCLQGFMTDNDALFFDPGRRFPGGEYERIIKRYTGIDMIKGMVVFALTGEWPNEALPLGEQPYLIEGKTTIRIQINVGSGTVSKEIGFDEAISIPNVEFLFIYKQPGDVIKNTGSTHQRYAQVVIGANNTRDLIKTIEHLYSIIDVIDENGESMLRSKLDLSKL
jgi:biotin carboxylase